MTNILIYNSTSSNFLPLFSLSLSFYFPILSFSNMFYCNMCYFIAFPFVFYLFFFFTHSNSTPISSIQFPSNHPRGITHKTRFSLHAFLKPCASLAYHYSSFTILQYIISLLKAYIHKRVLWMENLSKQNHPKLPSSPPPTWALSSHSICLTDYYYDYDFLCVLRSESWVS